MNRFFFKKIQFPILAIFTALIFSSCAGTDLNETIFVSSMGISLKNGIYSTALFGEYANEKENKTVSYYSSGRTPAEALNNAEREASMNIFLGHCEKIAANAPALRDSAFLSGISDSVVSPACKVYFSDSPEKAAEEIIDDGFETELLSLSVSAKNGTPVIIPTAEDPSRIALVTAEETVLLDSEDSFGVMLLRGEAFPRLLTVSAGNGFGTVKISPKAQRKAYTAGGRLTAEITISLNCEETDEETKEAAKDLIREICGSAYEKTVNIMGLDSVRLYNLTPYTKSELKSSRLILGIKD